MKLKSRALINGWHLAFLFLLLVCLGHAADSLAAPLAAESLPASSAEKAVAWLTPVLVPLLVAAAKRVLPKMPSGLLPALAPVLGMLISLINNLVTSHSSDLWLGAGLGLLGVAVRELKESVLPADNGGWPTLVSKPLGADPGPFAGKGSGQG